MCIDWSVPSLKFIYSPGSTDSKWAIWLCSDCAAWGVGRSVPSFSAFAIWTLFLCNYNFWWKTELIAIVPSKIIADASLNVFFLFCFFPYITKTCLFKHTENVITKKWIFSDKKILIFFLISAQNIDCGYSLEPPRRGGSNEYLQSMFWAEIRKKMYTPVNPSFTI